MAEAFTLGLIIFCCIWDFLKALTLFVYLAEFFGAPNFFRRAENFIRIFGTPKIFWARRKYFGHGKKKFVTPKIFWARRKKIRRAENIFGMPKNFSARRKFFITKLGMPKTFLSCRKWKGIISECPIFVEYPGLP